MALQEELPGTESETEQANRLFDERVPYLPGVLRVEPHRARVTGERSFTVYVRTGDLSARNGVYDLESEIYTRFPGARLDVLVREDS